MFISLTGVDDKGTEFGLYLNMDLIEFVIPEENAVSINTKFLHLTKDSMEYLTAFLKQTWLEED